jgi:hypothetical protein
VVSRRPCATTRSSHAVAGPGRHFDFAVAHGWEAAMWRRTTTRLRKRQRLEIWPVFKQWARAHVSLPNRRPSGPDFRGIKTFRNKKKIEELLKTERQCRLKCDSLSWKGMTLPFLERHDTFCFPVVLVVVF